MSERLSKRLVDGFTYAGGWDVRWDNVVRGFGVRVFPSGKKSFVYSYRHQGRKRLMTLGQYGELTVDEARTRAKGAAKIVLDGGDPLEEREKQRQGDRIADLMRIYVDHLRSHGKTTWRKVEQRLERNIPSTWRNRLVTSITRSEVAALHRDFGRDHPYEANRLLENVRAMFNLAYAVGLLSEDMPNPAERIPKFKEQKRARFVTTEEMPRLAKAIDHEDNVYVRAFFWLAILTGARYGELVGARWDQVDFGRRVLFLPETKSGEAQTIALSQPAVAILQGLPRLEGNPHVFPGHRNGRPFNNLQKPWARICKRAEVMDLRIHDLRRTVGSWMAQNAVDLQTIREGLRHASISTTLTYARLGDDPARQAFEEHGARVMDSAGKARAT